MTVWLSRERLVRIVVSVCLTCLLWLAVKLSKEYHTQVAVPIAYTGIPANLKLTTPLPTTLSVSVYGVGHQLAMAQWKQQTDTLLLDLSPYRDGGNVRTRNWQPLLAQHLPEALTIEGILPDTVRLLYAGKVSKRVPLVSQLELEPQDGYRFTRPVRFLPDSVTLQGTTQELSQITEWPTAPVRFAKLSESLQAVVSVQRSADIFVSPEQVEVEIPLDRFTEKRLSLPVTLINVPAGTRVRVLPRMVDVVALVPLDKFSSVAETDFTVVVDYRTLRPDGHLAFPTIVRHPGFVQGLRVDPPTLTYVRTQR
jgi:hypothetical protein